jgi:hypothetical protein
VDVILRVNKRNKDIHQVLQTTIDNLDEVINDLEQILTLVSFQDSIEPFEGTYCKDCHEPCGRSNAEIYNCMIKKISLKEHKLGRSDEKDYTKEHLEKDLEQIIEDLKKKYIKFKKILAIIKEDK